MVAVEDVVLLERFWPPTLAPDGWATRIGGRPNLPPTWTWPRMALADGRKVPLDFLAQIRLSDLPRVSRRGLLPDHGMLFFFAAALSSVHLEDLGPEAVKVLYAPGESGGSPLRATPHDAGWSQDYLVHQSMPAQDFRDPDMPRSELFPQCPVRAIAARLSDNVADHPVPTDEFEYGYTKNFGDVAPVRVADALLYVRAARNWFGEGVVSLTEDHPRLGLRTSSERTETFQRFRIVYEHWRHQSAAVTQVLRRSHVTASLSDEHRRAVQDVVIGAQNLAQFGGKYYSRFHPPSRENAAKTSLHELLLACPEFAEENAAEVAAAHPAKPLYGQQHRTLGMPVQVQGGAFDGQQPLLLLQLESDEYGPRFCWWDAGNITFWIDQRDAENGRFEKARAEIEGH